MSTPSDQHDDPDARTIIPRRRPTRGRALQRHNATAIRYSSSSRADLGPDVRARLDAAGLDHGSIRTVRSTVATQLAEAGFHPRKAQAFLGHAHMSTTMKYYTAVSDVDDAAGLLPDLP